tara:strand:+ start:284 stop:451 length:168 start_codon:yes stop_codon:yes gene_type:complete
METLPDGCIRVCVSEDGFEPVCCIVSSMHLVYQKVPQLRASLAMQAKHAILDSSY